MKALARIAYLLLLAILLQACYTTGKLVRIADDFAAKGNYDEAATYYYNALLKKPRNSHAQLGLRSNGQLVLNEKFATFSRLVLEQKIEEAMKQYDYAAKLAANTERVGVKLSWAYEYDEVYEDIKQEYLETLFNDALIFMNNKKYDLAEKQFERMAYYDSAYSGLSVLRLHTVLEPLYEKGIKQMAAARYEDAFRTFSRLCEIDDGFKDVKQRREEASAKATTKVGLLPVQNLTRYTGIEAGFDQILAQRIKPGSSFLHIMSADVLKPVLEKRGFTSLKTDTTVWQAAKSISLRYALYMEIIYFTDTSGQTQKEERTAYEAVTENVPNPYTGMYTYISKFKKITYLDSKEYRKVACRIRFRLLDLQSSRLLVEEILDLEKSDTRHAYVYNGKVNNLYEHLPKDNQMPPPDQEWRERFYKSSRVLLTSADLAKELQAEAAAIVIKKIAPWLN